MRLSEKSFTGCAVQGITSFRQSGHPALKDDIFSRPVDIARDSYESIVSDQAVYFAGRLFLSAVRITGGYYYVDVGRQLYQEMSARAKIQAEEIALIPTLRKEVEQKDIQWHP